MTRAEANRLLDLVRAGGTVTESEILFALWITGDLTSFSSWSGASPAAAKSVSSRRGFRTDDASI